MKIICTVDELGSMIRLCEHMPCDNCILKNLCDGSGPECFVSAGDIVEPNCATFRMKEEEC